MKLNGILIPTEMRKYKEKLGGGVYLAFD